MPEIRACAASCRHYFLDFMNTTYSQIANDSFEMSQKTI
jgi:hypothetical protein